MTEYARTTKVTVDRSRDEIEKTLIRFGADQFIYGWQAGEAVVGFRILNRQVRISVPIPTEAPAIIPRKDRERRKTPAEWIEHETMRRWRALAAVIKAKLIAVEEGISTVEREFCADIVLPDGRTLWQWAEPQVKEIYISGKMPPLLPGATGPVALLEGTVEE